MVRAPEIVGIAYTVNISLAQRGRKTDGELFDGAAVTAHRMTFKMGEHQQGIIAGQRFSNKVLFDFLSVGNGKLKIWTFGVHQFYIKIFTPPMFAQRFHMLYCRVAAAFISRIALHDSAAHMVDDGLPEIWF